MRRVGRLILATLVRGVLFLVPIVLVALLAREGYGLLHRAVQPIARLFPADRVAGILLEDVLSLIALALVFLVAGLFVGTRAGRLLSDRLEQSVLYRVPGYLLVRAAVGDYGHLGDGSRPEPVLVEEDDGWVFGLLVERLPHDYCTIFLPDSPSPTSGAVRLVDASRVHPLEVSTFGLLGVLTRSGAGAGALAAPILAAARLSAESAESRQPSRDG